MVPQGYEHDKSLPNWVNTQRCIHTKNKMRQDRKELLNEIRFVWIVEIAVRQAARETTIDEDDKWRQQYEKLLNFKRKNGHCRVPKGDTEDKSLANWLRTQRGKNTSNNMRLDRNELLDALGFVWRVVPTAASARSFISDDKKWLEQYEKLVEFKRRNGHCVVPAGYYKEDKDKKAFSIWVSKQRDYHDNNKMRQDRKELLVALDFVWQADTLVA
jgi:hypothetical protein